MLSLLQPKRSPTSMHVCTQLSGGMSAKERHGYRGEKGWEREEKWEGSWIPLLLFLLLLFLVAFLFSCFLAVQREQQLRRVEPPEAGSTRGCRPARRHLRIRSSGSKCLSPAFSNTVTALLFCTN